MEHPEAIRAGEPVRIAFCITELDVGGAERALVELVTRLDRQQFEPVVYALGPPPKAHAALLQKRLETSQVPVVFLGVTKRHLPAAIRRLAKLLRNQRPQILQCFLLHANFVGTLAAKLAGVPHILTGIRVAERRRWHHAIQRCISPMVDFHVCVSKSVAQFSQEVAGLPRGKLKVIPNGVDLSQYENVPPADLTCFGIPTGRRSLLFVGRLDEQKGVDRLLRAAPQLLSALPNHDLIIAGAGPLKDELLRLGGEMGILHRVHFVGWQSDLRPLLAVADLLLLPSRWEGMPNIVLEAMASRLPVVATNVEGIHELLGHAAAEQIVPPEDAAMLIQRTADICNKSLLRSHLASSNYRKVAEYFSLEHSSAAYQQLYKSLLATRNSARPEN